MRKTPAQTLLLAGILALAAVRLSAAELPRPGQFAIPFNAYTVEAKPITLAEYRGKTPVLLAFYQNFCSYCRDEFPVLKKLDEQYAGKGLQVIVVPIEGELTDAKLWSQEFKTTFPVVYDGKGILAKAYGVTKVPTNIFIQRDGKIAAVHSGYDQTALEKAAAALATAKQ